VQRRLWRSACEAGGRRPTGGPLEAHWRPTGGPLQAHCRPTGGPLQAPTRGLWPLSWRPSQACFTGACVAGTLHAAGIGAIRSSGSAPHLHLHLHLHVDLPTVHLRCRDLHAEVGCLANLPRPPRCAAPATSHSCKHAKQHATPPWCLMNEPAGQGTTGPSLTLHGRSLTSTQSDWPAVALERTCSTGRSGPSLTIMASV
jgi:hypothetical protein